MAPELYDSSDEVDARLNLLEHVGDDSVGETLTQDIIAAAARIDSQAAELVGLREQLARQAPVIEAARALKAANDEDMRAGYEWVSSWDDAEIALYSAVRALSVPAPPEAPEVTG